jgi:YgiT-type zinc finger domain-containing protein
VGKRLEDEEEIMNCHNCGARLTKVITDLPFKIRKKSIIILRNVPVMQCENCSEFLVEDEVMEKIDGIFAKIDSSVEVEILNYAA